MSGRSLPDLLRTNVLQRPETQSIDTSILRPVNFNQQGAKFVFEKKGILDSNSHLQLKLKVSTVNGAVPPDLNSFVAYLPTATGALSLIRRAYLTIGGRRVSNLDNVGHYNTYMRLHFSNEYKKGVIIPKQGGSDIFMGSTAKTPLAHSATSIRSRGWSSPYGVLGREGSEFGIDQQTGLMSEPQTRTTTKLNQQIKGGEDNCPTFMISLSQLIPFLKGVQLPLFAIHQEVALNIEWTSDLVGERFEKEQSVAGAVLTQIVEKDCLICADYLFYPDLTEDLADEIMNKGGYDLPYNEILVQSNTITFGAGNSKQDIQLAFGGKKVKSIVIQRQDIDGAGLQINNLGNYNSLDYQNGKTIQLNIDSNNWYSMPLKNSALQKAELDACEEGIPIMCCDYRYSLKNQYDATGNLDDGLTDRLHNGYAENSEKGTMNWSGIKLSNAFGQGKRVSNLPMIYTEEINNAVGAVDGTQRLLRFFVKTQRVVNISSGIVNVIE
jgi:hypothetical protein